MGSWRVGAVSIQYFERLHIKNKVAFNSIRMGIFQPKFKAHFWLKKKTNICADEPQVLLGKVLGGVPWNCSQIHILLLPLSTCMSHSCVLFCSYSDWAFWMSVKYNLEFCWFHWRIHWKISTFFRNRNASTAGVADILKLVFLECKRKVFKY